jgi:hypothetical protein
MKSSQSKALATEPLNCTAASQVRQEILIDYGYEELANFPEVWGVSTIETRKFSRLVSKLRYDPSVKFRRNLYAGHGHRRGRAPESTACGEETGNPVTP